MVVKKGGRGWMGRRERHVRIMIDKILSNQSEGRTIPRVYMEGGWIRPGKMNGMLKRGEVCKDRMYNMRKIAEYMEQGMSKVEVVRQEKRRLGIREEEKVWGQEEEKVGVGHGRRQGIGRGRRRKRLKEKRNGIEVGLGRRQVGVGRSRLVGGVGEGMLWLVAV